MSLLKEEDRRQIAEQFEALTNPVKLVMFTQQLECDYCAETRQLVEEVAGLSDKIEAEIFNFAIDKEQVTQYQVDKIPAIAVLGEKDYGIRFYGIPAGYEFTSLLEAILAVSSGKSDLADATKDFLSNLKDPLHIQVFVTPTCPYCPMAVTLAHKMALESDLVRGDMVEAMEFPHLAIKYQVQGVPRTVVNDTIHFEGALPEARFVHELRSRLGIGVK